MDVEAQELSFPARDGKALAATLYRPPAPRAVLLINSATAVRRQYYDAYARYAAGRGLAVLTYDYRGIAGSAQHARGARMQDWGEQDFAGAVDWLGQRYPGLPLLCIGHSAGGQIVGLAENNTRLAALAGVAAQSGWWKHFDRRQWPRLLAAWYLLAPVSSRVLGYVPGALIGGEKLPGGIARQWAAWCRQPHYISDDQGRPWRPYFSQLRIPVRFYAIADDHAFAPLPAVRAMAECYDRAQLDVKLLEPKRYGLAFMGHFGYFRKKAPTAAWDETLDWLLAQAG